MEDRGAKKRHKTPSPAVLSQHRVLAHERADIPHSSAEPGAIQEAVIRAGGVGNEVLHALSGQENYP